MPVACRLVALRPAFRNLMENSSIQDVRATVWVAQDDECLSVLMEAEGSGISAAVRERFSLLVKVHPVTLEGWVPTWGATTSVARPGDRPRRHLRTGQCPARPR